jgi:branched-chain amino acid transport system permease protein
VTLQLSFLLQVIVAGLLMGGIYALVAISINIILGVMNIVNFAQGSFMMLGMYTSFLLFSLLKVDPYVSVLISGPLLFCIGFGIQKLVIGPNEKAPPSSLLFLTLGLSIFIDNFVSLIFGPEFHSIHVAYADKSLLFGEIIVNFPRLIAFIIAFVATILLFLFLKKTDWGKALRATAVEREGAQLMGINIRRINLVAFGIGSCIAGVAGSLILPFYYVSPHAGLSFVITGFIVVVLGGMGNLVGSLIGGLIIGVGEAMGAAFMSGALQQLVSYSIFILILLFRPTGLMGGRYD